MLRAVLALVLLVLPMAACGDPTRVPAKKAAIEEIERRHTEDMVRMGGGGSSM
jgi:hypothetical protein